MKTTSLLFTAVAAALAVAPLHAQVLFKDDFTTSAQSLDLNFELSGGRQTGLLAPIPYLDTDSGGGGYHTQVNEGSFPQALFLFPEGGASSQQYASPNYNFNAYGAQLEISMTALNQSMEGGDYLGFDVGANNAVDLPYGGSGLGLVMRPHFTGVSGQNNFEIYLGSSLIATGNSPAIQPNSNVLSLTINATAFDGSPAAVELKINGTSIYADTIASGFTNNYITVGAGNFSGDNEFEGFDNLSVRVVPEPASAALLGLGALLLARRRAQRWV